MFGFVIGSGGLDGDGGIPDLDFLGGIGAHRSIFTHSIIAGAVVETMLVSTLELAQRVHPYLPAQRDPLWDQLIECSETLVAALRRGVSTGLAYHLGVDATVDAGGTYKDLPVDLPLHGHVAVMAANAATEGAYAARRWMGKGNQGNAQAAVDFRARGTDAKSPRDMPGTPKRVIVCGGRDFADAQRLEMALDRVRAKYPDMVLVHGAARGADAFADAWAEHHGILREPHPADWNEHENRGAEPIRNQAMHEAGADGVVAFPGGRDSAHMVRIAREAGVPVWQPLGSG